MSQAYRLVGAALPSTVSANHKLKCPLHKYEVLQCSALTAKGQRCRHKVYVHRHDSLPVCNAHQDQNIPAGRCQAIMDCGHACDRLGKANPPFNLCDKHSQGTHTLPCLLTEKLPSELLAKIFRYILVPEVIPVKELREECKVSLRSFLKLFTLNRQIRDEAEMVLYGLTPFEIYFSHDTVRFCNQSFDANNEGTHYPCAVPGTIESILPVFNKIRKIRMTIDINTPAKWGRLTSGTVKQNSSDILEEDDNLLALREHLRLFINIFRPKKNGIPEDHQIHTLEIRLRDVGVIPWGPDETLAAVNLTIDPLEYFGHVERPVLHHLTFAEPAPSSLHQRGVLDARTTANFNRIKSEWEKNMRRDNPLRFLKPYTHLDRSARTDTVQTLMNNIYTFTAGMTEHRAFFNRPDQSGYHIYDGIHRVTYLARLAYEQNDIDGLHRIREVLKKKWVAFQQMQQCTASIFSNSLLAMYPANERWEVQDENFMELWCFNEPPEERFDPMWSELNVADYERIPTFQGGAVIIADDRLRRYYEV